MLGWRRARAVAGQSAWVMIDVYHSCLNGTHTNGTPNPVLPPTTPLFTLGAVSGLVRRAAQRLSIHVSLRRWQGSADFNQAQQKVLARRQAQVLLERAPASSACCHCAATVLPLCLMIAVRVTH